MGFISDHMTKHHRECDEIFARAGDRASASDWVGVEREADAFLDAIERHIELEESLLFPSFEQATGMKVGPTRLMRVEHEQMRGLFARMRAAIEAKDAAQYDEVSGALAELMRLHNSKEEAMLYPLMDRALRKDEPALTSQLEAAIA